MGRRKKKAAERASELKDQAKEVAGQGGEALKGFASQTGSAAKEFASKTSDAAKELVESIEKAAKGINEAEEPKRRHRLLKLTIALGAGAFVATNERARSLIQSVLHRSGAGSSDTPEIWRPESVNGGSAQSATSAPGSKTTP